MEQATIHNLMAVVVWYNPTQQQVDAISCYQHDVKRVIIVDNSADEHTCLCSQIPNAEYIALGGNRGIAKALNLGCQRAMDLGADWVLTMDQDSLWKDSTVTDYVHETEQYADRDKVGIFCPTLDMGVSKRRKPENRFSILPYAMTSGNLLRLEAWKQIGGFLEDLFIDCVDEEFDCRLSEHKWQIVCVRDTVMTHCLGNGVQLLGPTKHPYTAHQPFRYYYIARNMQRIRQLHPDQSMYYRRRLWKELKRLCLYDWTDKRAKLCAYWRGWREGLQPYPTPFRLVLSNNGEAYKTFIASLPSIFLTDGKVIYDKRNQIRVFVLPNGEQINVKRYCRPSMVQRLFYSTIRKPKAQRAYENAICLLNKGISTPEPLGYILCGSRWLNESYLITRQVPYTHRFYEFRNHSVEGYEDVLSCFVNMCARMHRCDILHKDLSPGNILWDRDDLGEVHMCVVDVNRMSIGRRLTQRACCRNFCRLWGHMDFMHQLSVCYARNRRWDEVSTERRIIHYWKRFWHVRTEKEIDYLFRPLPID